MKWLEVKENLIIFENYTYVLKEEMRNTYVINEEAIKMSKLYFK